MTGTEQIKLPLQITFQQLLEAFQQLSSVEKKRLLFFLQNDASQNDLVLTHFASESILAKDWLSPQEDEAWKNL
jgi:hypothetical protein